MKSLVKSSANLITVLRIILVFTLLPLLWLTHLNLTSSQIYEEPVQKYRLIFIFIFICSALTDYLDGYIARKFKQQTLFGKCFDPIADKLLVIISFLYLYILSNKNYLINPETNDPKVTIYIMAVLIISIFRDLLIMGVRMLNAFEKNPLIASSFWGKIKTFVTFISIIFLLCAQYLSRYHLFSEISHLIILCLIINIILIIISGIEYMIKCYHVVLKTF